MPVLGNIVGEMEWRYLRNSNFPLNAIPLILLKKIPHPVKSLSGIVSHSQVSESISEISGSMMQKCEFSICEVEVVFLSGRSLDIADGDLVVVSGNMKGNRMTAFAIHDLSTNERENSGVISNLFVAVFVLIFGFFGTIATIVFIPPFSYAILGFTCVFTLYLICRSLACLVACLLVWRYCKRLKTEDEAGKFKSIRSTD